MKEDVMVIPLRVPREVGKEWKVAAVMNGQSVQRWILDRVYAKITTPVIPTGEMVKRSPEAPPLGQKPVVNVVIPSGKYGKPLEDEPIATVTCFKCKEKVVKWTMDPRGKPWCDSCIQDQKNAIA